ncbi:hypothetical protein [Mucilaginibacter sp. UYCu711]|uniref:hypothetical protein n=1 Tax=Mucilaginibacter sp. UYCu711 TaxID=3156339 RepID=UPI003D249F47
MLKSLLTFVFIAGCKLALCQTAEDFNKGTFTLFPHYKEDVEYFANIIPDSTYLYWQCVYNPGPYFHQAKEQIVFEKGDPKYTKLIKKSKSGNGFMVSCPPGFCSYYIIAIRPDKTILQVNNSQKFKTFLGKIDNLDEVRLAVRDQHYTIHNNSMKSGSYQERQDYYLLYLGDWESDMISDMKTSTKAILTKSGDFKILESTSYK